MYYTEAENLLIVKLDVTKPADAEAAVNAAVEKWGRIDVLVNNAANFFGGFFEELTQEQIEQQLQTSLYGTMIVTRAVLLVMRKQRSGHIIAISSTAGLTSLSSVARILLLSLVLKDGCRHCRLK